MREQFVPSVPLKYVASAPIRNGLGLPGEHDVAEWPRYIRTTDFTEDGELRNDTFASLPPEIAKQAEVSRGDILATAAGASIGKSIRISEEISACYAGFLVRIRPNSDIEGRYLFYWMRSTHYWFQIRAGAVSSTIENFSASKYRNLRVPMLNVASQRSVVEYLDRETAEIDSLIGKWEKLIALLVERRSAMISQAVTRGLDLSVPTQDSGVDWLGQVPSHWTIEPLGRWFTERKETVSDEDFQPLSVTKSGIMLQLDHVAKTENNGHRKLVRKGDFAINSRSDRKGSAGVSDFDGSVSMITTVSRVERTDPNFTHHLFRSVPFQEEFYRWGHGIVEDLWSTRWSEMKSIRIPIPPLPEQKAIAHFISNELEKANLAIETAEKAIELAKERRSALISAAVTGQIDVGEMA